LIGRVEADERVGEDALYTGVVISTRRPVVKAETQFSVLAPVEDVKGFLATRLSQHELAKAKFFSHLPPLYCSGMLRWIGSFN
jgi:hypothetical protein